MGNDGVSVRTVQQADMDSVIQLLQTFSTFKPSKSDFPLLLESLRRQSNVHSLVAIVNNEIVGYGSIVIGTKIRGGKMGHVEDIVSHPNYRKKGIGKTIVNALFEVAKANGCYKIALQCQEHNVEFYEKCNYEISGVGMQRFVK